MPAGCRSRRRVGSDLDGSKPRCSAALPTKTRATSETSVVPNQEQHQAPGEDVDPTSLTDRSRVVGKATPCRQQGARLGQGEATYGERDDGAEQ